MESVRTANEPLLGSYAAGSLHSHIHENSDEDLLDHRSPRNRAQSQTTQFVNRWLRRNSTALRSGQPDLEQMRDEVVDPFDNSGPAVADFSDSESLNSKPSTRRSSVDSSIDDVCMPLDSPVEDSVLEIGRKQWPDISVLNDFVLKEMKEQELTEAAELVSEGLRDRYAVNEAETDGPLRPPRFVPWAKQRSNTPRPLQNMATYRFTYFRDDLPETIHSPTISGLLKPGQSFEDLFPPVGIECNEQSPRPHGSTSAASVNLQQGHPQPLQPQTTGASASGMSARDVPTPATAAALLEANGHRSLTQNVADRQGRTTPIGSPRTTPAVGPPGHAAPAPGPAAAPTTTAPPQPVGSASLVESNQAPTPFWLDIHAPTEDEMRAIAKCFGIHPLTCEDVLLKETREKVELFRNYYFICFTSFDVRTAVSSQRRQSRRPSISNQSLSSWSSKQAPRKDRLKPAAIYIITFHTGVITVHYSPTPHTINVRRRIRLLKDYLNFSSDWISYALIDDITDGFAPMIATIEQDVTYIEDEILRMHGTETDDDNEDHGPIGSDASFLTKTSSTGKREWQAKHGMLRMIGESRKRVMSLMGLLANKADVIKGFSKRVTEQWSGAPRNEIAMYLSDIQDHLVTMVQSLNHYEKLLARSHSNYLAQLNIDMTKANNDMNDVLGKISALGMIVLPLNVVTGLWGMNVLVPGQHDDNSLRWFYSIIVCMITSSIVFYYIIKRYV